jgi:hypothetical protein
LELAEAFRLNINTLSVFTTFLKVKMIACAFFIFCRWFSDLHSVPSCRVDTKYFDVSGNYDAETTTVSFFCISRPVSIPTIPYSLMSTATINDGFSGILCDRALLRLMMTEPFGKWNMRNSITVTIRAHMYLHGYQSLIAVLLRKPSADIVSCHRV